MRKFCSRPHHLVRALKVGNDMKNVKNMPQHVQDTLEFALPSEYKQFKEKMEGGGFKAPSCFASVRSRLRLDITMMVCRRRNNMDKGWRRQLFFDSSPQKGVELFAVRQFAHLNADVAGGANRIVFLTTLGIGNLFQKIKRSASLTASRWKVALPALIFAGTVFPSVVRLQIVATSIWLTTF